MKLYTDELYVCILIFLDACCIMHIYYSYLCITICTFLYLRKRGANKNRPLMEELGGSNCNHQDSWCGFSPTEPR